MIRDLRFTLRTFRKNPGTSAVAVLILTLGIGANTVVFSLVHGLLLEPLDFHQPERLMRVFGTQGAGGRSACAWRSAPAAATWRGSCCSKACCSA